jgi:hypothetical protein
MNGIQSLMPGQAAPQGMPPGMPQGMPQGMQPQPSSPQQMMQSQTPMLKQLPKEQLVQLFAQEMSPGAPQKFTPLLILSAISDKVKQEQMQRAMQMQQVQQQNAQQPPGTVAEQVLAQAQQLQMPEQQPQMQPPVMAAHGGAMHSYADGGIVALRNGGDIEEERLREQIRNMFASAASPFNILGPRAEQERQRAQDIMRMLPSLDKEQMRNILGMTQRVVEPTAYQEFGPGERTEPRVAFETDMARRMAPYRSTGRDRPDVMSAQPAGSGALQSAAPMATAFDITNPASINALRMAAQDTSLPEAERADLRRRIAMMEGQQPAQARPMQANAPRPNLTPEEEGFYRSREAALQGRRTLPPEVLAGRQGVAALAAENLAAQRAEAQQFGEEARRRRDEAMARSGRNIFSDPSALLALAGSIDTRRGRGIGSAASGLAGILGQREAQAEAARKEYATAQQSERMLQANIRQANMLEAQRQQAIIEQEPQRVAQIEDALAKNAMERSQLVRQRQEYAEKMELEGRKVGAMEADAAAKLGRPTEIDFFRQDPEGYKRFQAARLGPRNEPKAMTYDQAADNVSKFLDTTAGMMEIFTIRKQAKAANQPEPSLTQIRDMLIQRELQGAGARTSAPLGGKVMTMADVQATATASGKTVDEVRKAATAAGYTIQ